MNDLIQIVSGPGLVRFGWALVHFLWQGAIIVAVLEAALALAGRKNAPLRYLLCGLALAAMPICLAGTYAFLGQGTRAPQAAISHTSNLATHPAPSIATASTSVFPAEISDGMSPAHALELNEYMPAVVVIWLVGVILLTCRKAGGFIVLWRLRRRGISGPDEVVADLFQLACEKIGVDARHVTLNISSIVQVPMTMGWLRPVVLFPATLLSGLGPREIELLLAHELAHIRRCDYLVNLVQTVVETLFFYHPVTWWISRRMRQERENCCDDLVAFSSGDKLVYAKALIQLETLRPSGAMLATAANGGNLLQRIQRLAGEPVPATDTGQPLLLTLLSIFALIAVVSVSSAQGNGKIAAPMTEAEAKQKGIAAEVNGKPILWTVVAQQNAETVKLLKQNLTGNDLSQHIVKSRQNVLHALVDRQLIIDDFRSSGKTIPADYIDERINDIVTDEYHGDRASFLKGVEERGSSLEKYRRAIEENAIVGYARNAEVVQKVWKYYQDNPELFPADDRINVSLVSMAWSGDKPSDKDRALAEKVLDEARKSNDWSALQKKYNYLNQEPKMWLTEQGEGSISSSPNLWPGIKDLQPGQITAVLEGNDFYAIARVNERRAATVSATGETTNHKAWVINVESERLQKEWLDRLRVKATVQIFDDPGETASAATPADPSSVTQSPGIVLAGYTTGGATVAAQSNSVVTTMTKEVVTDVGRLYHAIVYHQTSADEPKLSPDSYQFIADLANNVFTITGGTISLPPKSSWQPNPVTVVQADQLVGAHYLYAQGFPSKAALLSNFPDGDFSIHIKQKQSDDTISDYSVAVPFSGAVDYPPAAPFITNKTWEAGALVLSPTSAEINFTTYPGATLMTWEIVSPGMSAGGGGTSSGSLNLTGLLNYGRTYVAQLRFINRDKSMTASVPGAPKDYTFTTNMATIVEFKIKTPASASVTPTDIQTVPPHDTKSSAMVSSVRPNSPSFPASQTGAKDNEADVDRLDLATPFSFHLVLPGQNQPLAALWQVEKRDPGFAHPLSRFRNDF